MLLEDIFEDKNDSWFFDASDKAILDCMRFYFISLIRENQNLIKTDWNVHIILRIGNGGPRDRLDTMFNLSHCNNSENYLTESR